MSRRFKLIVFVLALFSSTLFHFLNHIYLSRDNPEALRNGVTVQTRDDASYLAPVENFLEGEGWKSNAVGKAAYTTRSPGYGFFYLSFRLFLDEKNALIALCIFQILLYAYAVTLVPGILNSLLLNRKWKQVLTISFACLPMFFGFLSYTLTEAVTPSLLIIVLALLVKKNKGERENFLLWLLLGFTILVRPPLIVWSLVLPILYFPFKEKNLRRFLVGGLIVFTPTLVWQVHLYNVTNEVQGLHPIYQDDSNTVYRPSHQAIWNFHKSWGQSGSEFHKSIDFLASAARYNREKEDAVSKVIQKIPQRVKRVVSVDSLSIYYGLYFDVLQNQAPYFKNQEPIPGLSENEKELIEKFEQTTKFYTRSDFFYSQLVVPARVFKQLALHSNLSLYIFQKPWRGNFFMEALRIICFANHFLAFYIFLISIFILFPNKNALLIIVPTACYLAYLCFVQRGIEERYTLPFLIPMVALSAKTLELLYRRSIHLMKGQ